MKLKRFVYAGFVASRTDLLAFYSAFAGTVQTHLARVLQLLGDAQPSHHCIYALQHILIHCIRSEGLTFGIATSHGYPAQMALNILNVLQSAFLRRYIGELDRSPLPSEFQFPFADEFARIIRAPGNVTTQEDRTFVPESLDELFRRAHPGELVLLERALGDDERSLRDYWAFQDSDGRKAKQMSFARRHPRVVLVIFAIVVIGLLLTYFLALVPKYGYSLLNDPSKHDAARVK